jgi:hypothetical protein
MILRGNLLNITIYEYEHGNKFKMSSYETSGGPPYYERYSYDEKGNLIEKIGYKSNSSRLISKETYKYDAKENEIELKEYNSGGGLEGYEIYKYDEKGNKIEADYFSSGGNLSNISKYKYDEKGNETEYDIYNKDHDMRINSRNKYVYDKYGNWIKRISYRDEKAKKITERIIEYY